MVTQGKYSALLSGRETQKFNSNFIVDKSSLENNFNLPKVVNASVMFY